MNEILVKKLNLESKDLNSISKSDLVGYLQTKDTINRISNYLVKPFEAALSSVGSGACDLFSSNGIYLGVNNSSCDVVRESIDVVSRFEEMLSGDCVRNGFGRRAYGVKRFASDLAFDSWNLNKMLSHYKNEVVSCENVLDTSVECSDLENVMAVYSPRLIFLEDEFKFDVSNLNESDVGFYVAGMQSLNNLDKNVVKPFEELFLSSVKIGSGKSMFGFSDLGVRVSSEVRKECDYKNLVDVLGNELSSISKMGSNLGNNRNLFFNSDLIKPRMYVGDDYLSDFISTNKASEMEVLIENVGVEYLPQFTHII